MQIVLPHPGVGGLYVSAEAVVTRNGTLSATGLSSCPRMAQRLSASELAERHVVADLRSRSLLPPDRLYGAGAGAEQGFARKVARLEMVERVAARRWWWGGSLARRPNAQARHAAATVLARHPRQQSRRTVLLDIASRDGLAVILAFSAEANGRGVCFGLACRARAADAAKAAVIELFQMEFALTLARARKAHGVTLPSAEKRLLDRARRMSAGGLCRQPLLRPRRGGRRAARPVLLSGWLHRAGLRHRLYEGAEPGRGVRVSVACLHRIRAPLGYIPPPRWPLY